MTAAAAYRYIPLEHADSFRLLLLRPSQNPASPLHGSLLNTTLSECDFELIDPWTALSYVWGPPSTQGRGTIILDETYPVPIGASLDSALRDLRDATRVRRVWADALCIDQQNVAERNRQVTMMGRIYSTANHTVIHLGELTDEARTVLSSVPRQYLYFLGVGQPRAADEEAVVELAKRDLLSRTWFRRVWIYQELILSKDPWVQCGGVRVRWTDLCMFLVGPPTWNNLSQRQLDDGLHLLGNMNYARSNGILGSAGTLLSLLQQRRGLGATDPRDFVYAHLGLARDQDEVARFIQVDYNKSVAEVYGQVARYVLSTDAAGSALANLLASAEERALEEEGSREEGLPSWAPDWRFKARQLAKMSKDNIWSRTDFPGPAHWVALDSPCQVLGILGYRVDSVEAVGPALPPCATVDRQALAGCKAAQSAVWDLYHSKGGIYFSGDRFGQYPHVPLRGNEEEHRRLCEAFGAEWFEFLTGLDSSESPNKPLATLTFCQLFRDWIHDEAKKERIFAGQNSHGLLRVMNDYVNGVSSSLDDRRLAKMASGSLGVVPAVASRGDVIVNLVNCEWPVVLKRLSTLSPDAEAAVEVSVRRALCGKFPDGGQLYRDGPSWSPDDDRSAQLGHFEILGTCCVDGHVGWGLQQLPAKEEIQIFALH
ncbi:heterokaryon incompatibility protein 6, OR allele [Cladorrhinum samala]|uniref:Heterokaryon incompatibility protein 6, OR allele n=1 Tax=Cladorrhinum samala TaxID=585594 RepID=A0AAV9HBR5_9PEZI|nr:heterokaryon incompatibility protein 6, OR allele [Cladorrhinum samala]